MIKPAPMTSTERKKQDWLRRVENFKLTVHSLRAATDELNELMVDVREQVNKISGVDVSDWTPETCSRYLELYLEFGKGLSILQQTVKGMKAL